MQITDITTHLVGSEQPTSKHGVTGWLIVQVHTDEGITGIGESGVWGYLEASAAAVETFKRYLVGKNPLEREHHWQYLYRNCHFRGAAISGALSAIDVALWDIAGKHFDVPAYELMGGQCRDKARVYAHVRGDTTDTLVERCEMAADEGFTAVGHLSPLLDEPRSKPYFETHAGMIEGASERVRAFREAVGTDVDLCIEIHRRLTPEDAIALGRNIEQYHPIFFEDPIPPDNFDVMGTVADGVDIPIATGERLHTMYEFEMLLERDAVQYIRPDVCLAGGLTHCKKIAALAEARHVGVVPHNPLSPVNTAACLQLAASIPNFTIQEYPFMAGEGRAPGQHMLKDNFVVEDGFIRIPDRPGIGIEFEDGVLEDAEFEPRSVITRLHHDGSIVDQ